MTAMCRKLDNAHKYDDGYGQRAEAESMAQKSDESEAQKSDDSEV